MNSLSRNEAQVLTKNEASTLAKRRGRTRLRTLFVSILALMMVACVLGLSLLWEPRVTQVMAEAQERNLDSKVDILSGALVPFLLHNDFGAIFETLESTQVRNPNWKSVTLTSTEGKQLYPLSRTQFMNGEDTISTERKIIFDDLELAVLSVGVDISDELGQIRKQVREVSVLLIMFFLGGLFLLGVLFERLVARRISILAAAARQLSFGNYAAQLPAGRRDEIGLLTDSFGSMRRTIKQNEEKLIASRDDAQRAAEAKSRFLAMMSHEIRTPLNGVIPTAELLLEGDLSPEQAQLVGTIEDSGKALKSIIDDILDISKLDEGRFIIRNEEFSIQRTVESVAGMFSAAAKKKGLSLDVQVDTNCRPHVTGDGDRLRQVLINLVGNATKFTTTGCVNVRVCVEDSSEDRQRLRFEVEDTGIGISEEDQEKIFERFTQVDNRSNRDYQGSGLGLSICKLLVSAMGGELQVKSRTSHGSLFYFAIDLKTAVSPVEESTLGSPERPAKAHRASGNKKSEIGSSGFKVLIVDDNRTNLKITSAILKTLKHSTETAESGEEALLRLKKEPFDLVLMDVNMPGIDGLETTRRVRNAPQSYSKTVILGLSASAFEEDIAACLEAGMNGFVAKPVSKKKLVAELEKYLVVA